MKRLIVLLFLAACGNTPDSADTSLSLRALRAIPAALVARPAAPTAAELAQTRAALQASGQPAIQVHAPGLNYSAFMVPYFPTKGGALTWSSGTYETVTLRDGILVWTRGLGPDLMASQAPSLAQVRAGQGSFHRIYEYLDGGDAVQSYDFDCDFAAKGPDSLTILDFSYQAQLVVETCSRGDQRFENRYWFDSSGKIRQSEQLLVPGMAPLRIQAVVD